MYVQKPQTQRHGTYCLISAFLPLSHIWGQWVCSSAERTALEHATSSMFQCVHFVLEHMWHATLLILVGLRNFFFISELSNHLVWHATTVPLLTWGYSKRLLMWHATQTFAFGVKENLPLVPLSVQRTETSILRGGCSADTFCLPVEAGLTATAHLELPNE